MITLESKAYQVVGGGVLGIRTQPKFKMMISQAIFIYICQHTLEFRYYDHEIQKISIFVGQILKTIL